MLPPRRDVGWEEPARDRPNFRDRDRVRRLRVSLARAAEDIRELRRMLLEQDDDLVDEPDEADLRWQESEELQHSRDSRWRRSVWRTGRQALDAAETFLYRLRKLQALLQHERVTPQGRASGAMREAWEDDCADARRCRDEENELDEAEREARDDEGTRGPQE